MKGGKAASVVAYLIIMVVLPVAITVKTVESPVELQQTSVNPTPLGYTISLSLFLIPMTALMFWMYRRPAIGFQKKAFWYTVGLLAPTGIVLDVLFGHYFFTFENQGAVLGILFPAVGGGLPVEELVFYISGFITVLLIYVWGDEYWFAKYNVPDYAESCRQAGKLLKFHWPSLLIAASLIILALIYKKNFALDPRGYPWYFSYLVIMALTPSMGLFSNVKNFINWRAFSFTFFVIVLISLIWETTLALPYEWWGFQSQAMMGLYIKAWYGLPIEEIVVWFSVSYATVIIYEAIKIALASTQSWHKLLLG